MIYVDNRQNKVEASEKLIERLTEVIEFALKEE
jgi:probable rRNA maturation factor